jgi:hypothetical protein
MRCPAFMITNIILNEKEYVKALIRKKLVLSSVVNLLPSRTIFYKKGNNIGKNKWSVKLKGWAGLNLI